ncbi:MAG: hypothetical protein DMD64_17230 [Gemmatimonadetes bacterium]|nr:MAG: hypothetical protein DMD64_17230 [Gemmatimonadota bacterium]
MLFTHRNVELQLDWWLSLKHRRMLRRLTGLIAGSDLAGTLVRRDAPKLPIAVIPQLGAAAPHEPQHVPHEGLAIGFVGRLVPQKGLDNLLQALALQRAAKWRLTIVGDGPDRERLEQLATELRLAARVRWTGGLPAEHVTNLWPDLDVLVLPSRSSDAWRETNGGSDGPRSGGAGHGQWNHSGADRRRRPRRTRGRSAGAGGRSRKTDGSGNATVARGSRTGTRTAIVL